MTHLFIYSKLRNQLSRFVSMASSASVLASSFLTVSLLSLSLVTVSKTSIAGSVASLIDDFSHNTNNSFGLPRQFANDTMVGGGTQTNVGIKSGVLHISGEIIPPRGQPGWASAVLLLDGEGKAVDASHFKGIRMLIKINSGNVSVSANSIEVLNYDYHSSIVKAPSKGQFHEIKIPFDALKRNWSEQTHLNTTTINSLSIVAFGMQKSAFDYEIDEISFY